MGKSIGGHGRRQGRGLDDSVWRPALPFLSLSSRASRLDADARPAPEYVMAKTLETDLCIIGGGSGGLSVAAAASQMGANTVLVSLIRTSCF